MSDKNPNEIITFNLGGQIFSTSRKNIARSDYLESRLSARRRDCDEVPFIDEDFTTFKHIWRLLLNPERVFPAKYRGLVDYYGIKDAEKINYDYSTEQYKIIGTHLFFTDPDLEKSYVDARLLPGDCHDLTSYAYNTSSTYSESADMTFIADKPTYISAIYFGNSVEYSEVKDIFIREILVFVDSREVTSVKIRNMKDLHVYYDIIGQKSEKSGTNRVRILLPGIVALSDGQSLSVRLFTSQPLNRNIDKKFYIYFSDSPDRPNELPIHSKISLDYSENSNLSANINSVSFIYVSRDSQELQIKSSKILRLSRDEMYNINMQGKNRAKKYYKIPINREQFASEDKQFIEISAIGMFYLLTIEHFAESAKKKIAQCFSCA